MTHYRVQARGRLGIHNGQAADIWSASIGFVDQAGDGGYTPTDQAHLDAAASAAMGSWGTFIGQGAPAAFPTGTSVDEVRVYVYNPGVKKSVAIGYSTQASPVLPPVVGLGSTQKAGQCAIAISLVAAGLRTKPKRGRFYVPDISNPVGLGNVIFANAMSPLASSAIDMVAGIADGMSNALGSGLVLHPAILSADGTHSSRAAVLRVGNVTDTIRSRRNAQDEVYEERSFV